MKAQSSVWPSASSPLSVEELSARVWPAFTLLAAADGRAVVDAGALVGADELVEGVALLAGLAVVDDDRLAGDALDHAVGVGGEHLAGVDRRLQLHAGADERDLRPDERHGLPLHVGAHQRAVGVVVLEERDERGGDGDDLLRREVQVVDVHAGRSS